MEITFSIIVPVFNQERFLNKCIQSILNQDYPFYEIIIIDDGSTDRSPQMCDAFESENVKVVHQQNSGQIVSRLNGIKMSTNDYLMFVDSDDYLESDALSTIVEYINKGFDCAIFGFKKVDDKDEIVFEHKEQKEELYDNNNRKELYKKIF